MMPFDNARMLCAYEGSVNSISLRLSAYLCVRCVKSMFQRRGPQRYAERRREIRSCEMTHPGPK
jgi:hypothetical protein